MIVIDFNKLSVIPSRFFPARRKSERLWNRLLQLPFILLVSSWTSATAEMTADYSENVEMHAPLGLDIQELVADQTRNLVYMIDVAQLRLLVFDTDDGYFCRGRNLVDTGRKPVEASVKMAPVIHEPSLVVSPDHQYIYTSLGNSQIVEQYDFATLELVNQWSYPGRTLLTGFDECGNLLVTFRTWEARDEHEADYFARLDPITGEILHFDAQHTVLSEFIVSDDGAAILSASIKGYSSRPVIHELGCAEPQAFAHEFPPLNFSENDVFVRSRSWIFDQRQTEVFKYGLATGQLITDFARLGDAGDFNSVLSSKYNKANNTLITSYGRFGDTGVIHIQNAENGELIADMSSFESPLPISIIAASPNGRIFYYVPGGTRYPDAYFGLWGSSRLNVQLPGPHNVRLTNVQVQEVASDGPNVDWQAGPGEQLSLSGTLHNLGAGVIESGVLLFEVVSSNASFIGSSEVALPKMRNGDSCDFSKLTLSIFDSAKDRDQIELAVTVLSDGVIAHSESLFLPVVDQGVFQVYWLENYFNTMVTDHDSEVVYIADTTYNRVIALDTESGEIVGDAALVEREHPTGSDSLVKLKITPDGRSLFALTTGENYIQSFSLPNLVPTRTFRLPYKATDLAIDANDNLYVTPAHGWWDGYEEGEPPDLAHGRLTRIDAFNGASIQHALAPVLPPDLPPFSLVSPNLYQNQRGDRIIVTESERTPIGKFYLFEPSIDGENVKLSEIYDYDSASTRDQGWLRNVFTTTANYNYAFGDYWNEDHELFLLFQRGPNDEHLVTISDGFSNTIDPTYNLAQLEPVPLSFEGWRHDEVCFFVWGAYSLTPKGRILGASDCYYFWIEGGPEGIDWFDSPITRIAVEVKAPVMANVGEVVEFKSALHKAKHVSYDNSAVTYAWSLHAGDADFCDILSPEADKSGFNFSVAGEYIVRLSVYVGGDLSGICDRRIHVMETSSELRLEGVRTKTDFLSKAPIELKISASRQLPYLSRIDLRYINETQSESESASPFYIHDEIFFERGETERTFKFNTNTYFYESLIESAIDLFIEPGPHYRSESNLKTEVAIIGSKFVSYQDWAEALLDDADSSGYRMNPDGDPFTNYEEYIMGLDPNNPDFGKTLRILPTDNGSIRIEFDTFGNVADLALERLEVQSNNKVVTDLIEWNGFVDTVNKRTFHFKISDEPADLENRFFRVRQSVPKSLQVE